MLETFGGGGTLMAAQLNRKCCAIELEPKYYEVIVRRYREYKPDAIIEKARY